VIGKNTHLPAKFIVGRNVEIAPIWRKPILANLPTRPSRMENALGWIRSDYQANSNELTTGHGDNLACRRSGPG